VDAFEEGNDSPHGPPHCIIPHAGAWRANDRA
jgi:hypothetical protein